MLKWSDQFATGSPLIDTQHKVLIEKINHLEEVIAHPIISKRDADAILSFLESYTTSHFSFEEQCMQRYNCGVHEKNTQAHQQFLVVFREFKTKYLAQGPNRELMTGLHRLASSWIQQHILSIDIQLKPCIPH